MENKLINLVKEVLEDPSKLPILESICELCEGFRFSYSLDEMMENLYQWLHKQYDINDMTFSLFDMEKNFSCVLLSRGNSYFLDGETSFILLLTQKQNLKQHSLLVQKMRNTIKQ